MSNQPDRDRRHVKKFQYAIWQCVLAPASKTPISEVTVAPGMAPQGSKVRINGMTALEGRAARISEDGERPIGTIESSEYPTLQSFGYELMRSRTKGDGRTRDIILAHTVGGLWYGISTRGA